MHLLLKTALAGGTAVVLAAAAYADSRVDVESILGPWLTEKEGAVIDMYKCGADGEPELCGRIVWLRKPYNDDGKLKRDPENPEASLRDRPLCGIEVVTGLKRTDRNTWAFGRVYNPKDGKHYRAYLDAGDDGTVSIRGYLGIPLFGKSETWTRPEGIDIGCPEG